MAAGIEATISVGTTPWGIAVDEGNGKACVANGGDNTVSIIHLASATVSATISVGTTPRGVCFASTPGHFYVSHNGSSVVTVIDSASETISATIDVSANGYGVAYDSTNNRVWLLCSTTSDEIDVLNCADYARLTHWDTGGAHTNPAYDSDLDRMWCSNYELGKIFVYNASDYTLSASLVVSAIEALAYDGVGVMMFSRLGVHTIYHYNTADMSSVTSTGNLGSGDAYGIVVDTTGEYTYCAGWEDALCLIGTPGIAVAGTTIDTNVSDVRGVAVDETNTKFYIVGSSIGAVIVVSGYDVGC